MPDERPLFEARRISKQFSGNTALSDVDFRLNRSQTHALLGENGAGKSTLSKIIAGVYPPTGGTMFLEGSPYSPHDRHESANSGVYIIYQESTLVPSLSVAENMFLGKLARFTKHGFISWNRVHQATTALLAQMQLDISSKVRVSELSLGVRKLIEFAKASYFNPKILIIDEATAFLNNEETRFLFDQIRKLRALDTSIIYISHHLEEIFQLCTDLTILKDGKVVATMPIDLARTRNVPSLMVGRDIHPDYFRKRAEKGHHSTRTILSVSSLSLKDTFRDVTFDLHEGEILGIGGLVGSGKEELAETLFGEREADSGTITVDTKRRATYSIVDAIGDGIGYIPRERDLEGLILIASLLENISLPIWKRLRSYRLIRLSKAKEIARHYLTQLRIKTSGLDAACNRLSGGNRQKIVLAKWLATEPRILILNNPTRGIDVGVKTEIYDLISELAKRNVAALFVSDELPELIGMCDRIITMRKKVISGTFENVTQETTEHELIQHML